MASAIKLVAARGEHMGKVWLTGSSLSGSRKTAFLFGMLCFLFVIIHGALFFAEPLSAQTTSSPQYPALPSETPAKFVSKTDSFEYVRRDVMIPMRDGIKLHTVILVPKSAKDAPILLTRTPYSADELTSHDPRGGEERNAA